MKKNLLLTILASFCLNGISLYSQCNDMQVQNFVSENLLQNASFEEGNTNINSDFTYFGNCEETTSRLRPGFYSVVSNGVEPFECHRSFDSAIEPSEGDGFMVVNFPRNDLNLNIWCQKINVTPHSFYEFDADLINLLNPINNAPNPEVNIVLEGNNGSSIQIAQSTSQFDITEGSGWLTLRAPFYSDENVEVRICIQNTVNGNGGRDLGIDNLSVRQFDCIDSNITNEKNDENTFYDCDETIDGLNASVMNGGFETGSYFIFEDGSVNLDQTQIDNWSRAAFDRNIQITDSGHNSVVAYEGNAYSRVNAISNSSIYQDIATVPGDILHYSFAHRGAEGVDQIAVYLGTPKDVGREPLSSELVNSYSTDKDRWVLYEGKYEVPAGQTVTRFSLGALKSSNGDLTDGNLIDAISVQSVEASCETPMRGNVEICENGLDDDNDGLTDANDPDCSTSGGNNGGLESNGRLAEKIFKRSLDRRIEPSKIVDEKVDMIRKERTARYGVFGQTNEKSLRSIEEFIPIDTIANTETFISSPTDLENITNATEVFSVDIFREDNRLAAVFATTTEKGVYEHTKYICDRLKGGIINDIKTIKIGNADFIVTDLIQPEGNREYALSFSARENKEGFLDVESHWSLENYSREDAYYNFQIWASNEDDLKALTLKTLQLLYKFNPIQNIITSGAPSVFVSQGEYRNGQLDLKIINKAGSTNITVEGAKSSTETTNSEAINVSASLSGAYSEFVSIEVGPVYDMGFRIKHNNDVIFDDLFIADGLWFAETQEENINFQVAPDDLQDPSSAYQLERSVRVTGTVTNDLNIYRTLRPNFVAEDVSEFNTLHFELNGTQALQVILVREGVTEWEAQYKTSITTSGASNEIDIPLSRFSNGSGEEISLNDIQAVIFKIENGGETQEVDIEISNLEFRNQEDTKDENAFASSSIIVTPNPSAGDVDVSWMSAAEGIHNAFLVDINGRMVQEFRGLTSVGHNQIVIERKNLVAGVYFFSIVEQSGELRNKKIVMID